MAETCCSTAFLFFEDLVEDVTLRNNIRWKRPFFAHKYRQHFKTAFTHDMAMLISNITLEDEIDYPQILENIVKNLMSTPDNLWGAIYNEVTNLAESYLSTRDLKRFYEFCKVFSDLCLYILQKEFSSWIPMAILAIGIYVNDKLLWNERTDFSIYHLYAILPGTEKKTLESARLA